MKPGMANISRNVASLPNHVTSKRAMREEERGDGDRDADEDLADEHGDAEPAAGAASSMMIATRATMNSRRSTVGSNFLPNSLTWPSRRAR